MKLKKLQEQLQQIILQENNITDNLRKIINDFNYERIDIYKNSYKNRVIETLSEQYPKIKLFLGNTLFCKLAAKYAYNQPSKHKSLVDYGVNFPDFIASTNIKNSDIVYELAMFEAILNEIFLAKDEKLLTFEDLFSLKESAWPDLKFKLIAGCKIFNFNSNCFKFWQEINEPQIKLRKITSQTIFFWRQDYQTYFRKIDNKEKLLLENIKADKNFSTICENLLTIMPEKKVPIWVISKVQELITAGCFCAFISQSDR